jgi:membrane protein DedA with SNARE-associated domain
LHKLLDELLAWYQHSLQAGGYPYIVFLMALESSVVPLPSEFIVPPAVLLVMAGKSDMTFGGIVLAGVIGSWIGATLMYWAARIAGRPIVMAYGSRFMITPEKVMRAERWFDRFGSFGVLLSRVVPVVRHLIGIPAGIMEMTFWKYSLFTVIGSALWCGVLGYVSLAAGKDQALMHGEIREVTIWITGAALVLGAIYYFLVHRMTEKEA